MSKIIKCILLLFLTVIYKPNLNEILAQNILWSIPNKYFYPLNATNYSFPSTNLNTPYKYTGQQSEFAHNAMSDAKGNLLFFIVDGAVFDKDGFLIDVMYNYNIPSNNLPSAYFQHKIVRGETEFCIVPVPGDCKKYYIFSAQSFHTLANGQLHQSSERKPYYAILDLDAPNDYFPNDPLRKGALSVNNDGTAIPLAPLLPNNFHFPGITDGKRGNVSFAASKVRNDNSRFIFVTDGVQIFTLRLDINGLTYVNNSVTLIPNFASLGNSLRCEMELVEVRDTIVGVPTQASAEEMESGNIFYRLALGTEVFNLNNPPAAGQQIFVTHYDYFGMNQPIKNKFVNLPRESNQSVIDAFPYGLEFSANRRYLFFTHKINAFNPNPVEYIDCESNLTVPPRNAVNFTGISNYASSYLELAGNGVIYMANNTGLAGLINTSTPQTNLSFNNNITSLTYNLADYGNRASGQQGLQVHLLPDQIDGMDYSTIQLDDIKCCRQAKTYFNNSQTLYLNANTAWNSALQIDNKIFIPAGRTLTISNTQIEFTPNGRIEILQGGKLIVDNSVLTSFKECSPNDIWRGVAISGNNLASQSHTNQGVLIMRNNSRIENADTAVLVRGGGIIQATKSAFVNNVRAVEFLSTFVNILSFSFANNNSSFFHHCTFNTTQLPSLTAPSDIFKGYVNMRGIRGITFMGCSFDYNGASNKISDSAYGIKAFSSVFYVNQYCNLPNAYSPCPSSALVSSSFSILPFGIDAGLGSQSGNFFYDVFKANFTNNLIGIRNNSVNNFRVRGCNFILGNIMYPYDRYGMLVNRSTGYKIEHNKFENTNGINTNKTTGLFIFQSGSANNEVYGNLFENLKSGSEAWQINRNNAISPRHRGTGLQYICNEFKNNNAGLIINPGSAGNLSGIRNFQGSPISLTGSPLSFSSVAAGNKFTGSNLYNHILNQVNYMLTYLKGSSASEDPNSQNIIEQTATNNNFCPNRILPPRAGSDIFGKYPQAEIEQMQTNFQTFNSAYISSLYNYNQLIDGGNTNALLNSITSTWPQEAWELRNELMAASPFVSEEALRHAALQTNFPQAMLLEVILANPEVSRNQEFIDFLSAEIPNPLPQYMIDLIEDNRESATTRSALEKSILDHSWLMSMTTRELKEHYLNDTLNNVNDTLDMILNQENDFSSYYQLASNAIENDSFALAASIISSKMPLIDFTPDLLIEHQMFMKYLQIREAFFNEGKTIYNLEQSHLDSLIDFIAVHPPSLARSHFQNILYYLYDIDVFDNIAPIEERPGLNSKKKNNRNNVDSEFKIEVFPNPAVDYTTIKFNLEPSIHERLLQIADIQGHIVFETTLKQNQGQLIWDTRNIQPGNYVYKVIANQKVNYQGKIIVKR